MSNTIRPERRAGQVRLGLLAGLALGSVATAAVALRSAEVVAKEAVGPGAAVGPSSAQRLRHRAGLKTALSPGQLDVQNEMYDYSESWYDLSYVRNSAPRSEDRGSTLATTRPGLACRETAVNAADNIDEFPLFSTIPSNIFLGSILKGDTLLTNTYGVFSGPRNSGKMTISVPYIASPIGTETMSPISQANYLDALRRILSGGKISSAASTGFNIEQIFSQDQLNFEMKANVSGTNFDVSARFKIDQTETRQFVLVSVTQLFFRLYFDRPDYGSEFFANNLSPQDVAFIKKEMTVTNPPLYVSAIDYGRKAYVLFETSDTSLDIEAAVTAGYNDVVDADGEITLELKKKLASMQARGFIIGGSSKLGANTIADLLTPAGKDGIGALDGIRKWLREGAEPSIDNPPAALSYEIALLLDGSKVVARSTTSYKDVDCSVGVCPSGFFWGKKNQATWFEISPTSQARIAPAAGLIGDTIDIQDGSFYTYTFPTCNRILWSNVSLQCVKNERRDFDPLTSPPGVWTWRPHPNGKAREITTDINCFDSNANQQNATSRRINLDGTPVDLDGTNEGFARNPSAYWRWKND